jgi:outer membrane protein assembly factor BamB
MHGRLLLSSTLLLLFATTLRADDWPQWMGPTRDGVYAEKGLLAKFPASGAKVLWRMPIAGGYAGPAVAGDKVFVTDFVKEAGDSTNDPSKRSEVTGAERVLCFARADGKLLWKHADPRAYKISYPAGPRTTPTVAGGKVYTLGAEGHLLCLDAENGEVVWSKDLQKEYKIDAPIWGFCGHPLVDGQQLICLVGGEGSVVVSFDKDSGKELWRALSAPEPGYCPPSIIEAGGARQLLIWHPKALNSLNPKTGEVYWSIDFEPSYGMSVTRPQQAGDFLYASGIGDAALLLKLDRAKPAAEEVWRGEKKTAVYCSNSTPLIADGVIYGADCQVGALRGVKLSTGERLWETFVPTTGGERRASHGTAFLVKNGDRYFLFSETGDLIIAKLSAEGYEELSRAKLLEPTGDAFGRPVVWSHPAFAHRCVFARNDEEIVCVSLAE